MNDYDLRGWCTVQGTKGLKAFYAKEPRSDKHEIGRRLKQKIRGLGACSRKRKRFLTELYFAQSPKIQATASASSHLSQLLHGNFVAQDLGTLRKS
jgi:hypothetical protein